MSYEAIQKIKNLKATNLKLQTIKGFTLVELAIVLLVVGLITAGITQARSLIHSSKLNKMASEVNEIATATRAFRLQFDGYYPGDFKYATDYWGGNTADGNGDDKIECSTESLRTFEQMSLAGIIKDTYEYTTPPYVRADTVGALMPTAYDPLAGYHIYTTPVDEGMSDSYEAFYTNDIDHGFFIKAARDRGTWSFFDVGFISSIDAKKIDDKHDDGLVDSGWIRANSGYDGSDFMDCITETVDPWNETEAEFDLSDEKNCIMFFMIEVEAG